MTSKSAVTLALAGLAVALSAAPAYAQSGDLKITLVVDGTLTHAVAGAGSPKFIELQALNNIPNLSVYALSRGGNGLALDTLTANHVLPNVALTAGQFYYVAGSSFQDYTLPFKDIYPALNAVRNHGVNSNGNDVTALLRSPSGNFENADGVIVDAFGQLLQDGIGTPWFHEDGFARSLPGRAPSSTFNVANWHVTAQTLDGLTAAQHAAILPIMGVPEPTGAALALIALLGCAGLRRRVG